MGKVCEKYSGLDKIMKIFNPKDIIPELINILLKRQIHFNFDLLPFLGKDLSNEKIYNFFIAGLNQFAQQPKPLGYPVIAQVEPVNFCNLSCPLCLTTSQTEARPKKMLSLNAYQTFIHDIGAYLLLLVLWGWGEPLLNPDIIKMIQLAKSKNILVHLSTNGSVRLSDQKVEGLVNSGLDSLVFAVDGATQESYSSYRKGGNLNLVLSNLKRIVRTKKKYNSHFPIITLRFIIMAHNEKELPQMKKIAHEAGVDFFTVRGEAYFNDKNNNFSKPGNTRYQLEHNEKNQASFICMRPWKRIIMDASEEIIPCEFDYKSKYSFGNIKNNDKVLKIWKGKKASRFRKEFNLGTNHFYHCKSCIHKIIKNEFCNLETMTI